jgi:DNA-binding GntR family transcriptional regulator
MREVALKELNPVEKQSRLGDLAYREMKERLIRGAFEPGRKLTVRAVAEGLGVSSTPARDALNRLSFEGALVYAGPKTVIVPFLTPEALQEITLMRLALEGLAAEHSVKNIAERDIGELEAIQVKINNALEKKQYMDALWNNKEFHFTIYRLSDMPHLISVIETLWLRIGSSFHDLYPEFAVARYGVHNHRSAIEGLKDRDSGAVRAAIESDIRDGYRRLRKAIIERSVAKSE